MDDAHICLQTKFGYKVMSKNVLFFSSFCKYCNEAKMVISDTGLNDMFILQSIDNVPRQRIPPQVDRVPMICTRNKEFLKDDELFIFLKALSETGGLESYSNSSGYTPSFGFLDQKELNDDITASTGSYISFDSLLQTHDIPPPVKIDSSKKSIESDTLYEKMKAMRDKDDELYGGTRKRT